MTAYLFVDTDAFEVLVAQPENKALQRDAVITGYETYIVEQWALDRATNCVICSYTGDSTHATTVQTVGVPEDLGKWSLGTRKLFEELEESYILPQKTPMGSMLITALASFPADLTLVPFPGKYAVGKACFTVNENLKRLAIVGRVAVAATTPSDAAIATFRKTFCVPEPVDGVYAVLELVTLVQLSLFYFGVLEPSAVDGFLCNATVGAIASWWRGFGSLRFAGHTPRPESKMYMRTSCCALLGAITGARQRLRALGLKPPKDPFDVDAFTLAVRKFQKMARLAKTAILDQPTYEKLMQETTHLGGQNMLSAMKSTVKESLSGKATGGVNDWETLDLDRFVASCRGHRAKYLFQNIGSPDVPHLTSTAISSRATNSLGVPLISLATVHKTKVKRPNEPSTVPSSTSNSLSASSVSLAFRNHDRQKSDSSMQFSSPERNPKFHFSDEDDGMETDPHHYDDDDEYEFDTSGYDHAYYYSGEDEEQRKRDVTALLIKDDLDLPRPEKPVLRRTASLSKVENVVFPWHSLAPVPEIVGMYQHTQKLESQLREQFELEQPLLARLEQELSSRSSQTARVQTERYAARTDLRTAEKRRERVLRQAQDLQAAMDRVDYEVAALNLRLKEVDQAVATFVSKVDALDARCAKAHAIRPDAWYTKLVSLFK